MPLPERIMREYGPGTKWAKGSYYGVPFEELTREELLAIIAEQTDAQMRTFEQHARDLDVLVPPRHTPPSTVSVERRPRPGFSPVLVAYMVLGGLVTIAGVVSAILRL